MPQKQSAPVPVSAGPGQGSPLATALDAPSIAHASDQGHPGAELRIIARPVPWPSLAARPDRSGLRLRWDALREDTGEMLAARTEYPLADAAHALMMRGVPGDTPVTFRHEASPHDSFLAMPLRVPAARGAARAAASARLAARRLPPGAIRGAHHAAQPNS